MDHPKGPPSEDDLERLRYLHTLMEKGMQQIPIARAAFAWREPSSNYGGAITRRLVEEAREGRLRTVDELDRTRGALSEKRRNPGMTLVDRDDVRAYVEQYGDDSMRRSALGVWAGLWPLAAFEATIMPITVRVERVDGPIQALGN